jgi:transcription initiation factor TFIIIB Brf1 subunit/transcription initiation factor TFIIB
MVHDSRTAMITCTTCGVVSRFTIDSNRDTFLQSERLSGVSTDALVQATFLNIKGSQSKYLTVLQRTHQRVNGYSVRRATNIVNAIDALVDRMQLCDRIRVSSQGAYRELAATKPKKTKKDELLAAVCIAVACRHINVSHSFKELASCCQNVTRKELGRGFKNYVRVMRSAHKASSSSRRRPAAAAAAYHGKSANEMMPRYASLLGMVWKQEKLCRHIIERAERDDLIPGRNPLSCLGGALFMTSKVYGIVGIDAAKVALVLQIAENTIRKACRDLVDNYEIILDDTNKRRLGISSINLDRALK